MSKANRRHTATKIIFAVLIVCAALIALYLNDYYKATDEVDKYLQSTENGVTVTEIADGLFIDGEGKDIALIFYPGAKVEYTAYLPLMYELAQGGVDVFIIKMPCNLAILGADKADDILSEYDYNRWYLGGHSLGGAIAANYAAKQAQSENCELEGLVLLAAYPTKSLKDTNLSVITIYGSEDTVLNMSKVKEGRALMPQSYEEDVLSGGNHAQFGCYGAQKGDKTAKITKEEQWSETAELVLKMIENVR